MRCVDDPEKYVPFQYGASDIVIDAAYRNRHSGELIALRLDPDDFNCDGPPGDEWATHWFLVAQAVRSLGAGFDFVGAGDYDADGSSEVLFWYGGYNANGYTLFFDDFAQRSDFRWTYQ